MAVVQAVVQIRVCVLLGGWGVLIEGERTPLSYYLVYQVDFGTFLLRIYAYLDKGGNSLSFDYWKIVP